MHHVLGGLQGKLGIVILGVTVDIDEKIRAAIDRSRTDEVIEINYVGLSVYLWEVLGKRQGYDEVIERMFFK